MVGNSKHIRTALAVLVSAFAVLAAALACSLPGVGAVGSEPQQETGTSNGREGGIPSEPVGLNRGLASLNSYDLMVEFSMTGPSPEDEMVFTSEVERTVDPDASHSITTTRMRSEEDPTGSESESEEIQVGQELCVREAGADWQYQEVNEVQSEIMSLYTSMWDLVPLIEDPTFVGEERMNGVETNHFSFEVAGFGADSGQVVSRSEGVYWLAQDGQYIVRYELALETRTAPEGDPEAEVTSSETLINVTKINQPVEIKLPGACGPEAETAQGEGEQPTREPVVGEGQVELEGPLSGSYQVEAMCKWFGIGNATVEGTATFLNSEDLERLEFVIDNVKEPTLQTIRFALFSEADGQPLATAGAVEVEVDLPREGAKPEVRLSFSGQYVGSIGEGQIEGRIQCAPEGYPENP